MGKRKPQRKSKPKPRSMINTPILAHLLVLSAVTHLIKEVNDLRSQGVRREPDVPVLAGMTPEKGLREAARRRKQMARKAKA